MKLVSAAQLIALAVNTAALAQHPYKCQHYDWNCETLLPPALPPQPLAPQAGYGPGRPHKVPALRLDLRGRGECAAAVAGL